ncbi:MAG: hypothetical protein IT438_03655 [Phycisphaerales bacterium]|nr:hypothetical protein [Phycisphaerales bacterium]
MIFPPRTRPFSPLVAVRTAGVTRAAVGLLAIGSCAVGGANAQVRLHDGSPAGREVTGVVVSADASGIFIAETVADPKVGRLVGWDRVRTVEGPDAAKYEPYRALADRLWRARTRLERGDWLAASGILRELAPAQARRGGPTGAVVFEGLLRCELARGAHAAALGAWFEWLMCMDRSGAISDAGLTRPGNWVGGAIDSPVGAAIVVDAKTALCPALPPIWVGQTAIDAAVSSGQWETMFPSATRAAGQSASAGSPEEQRANAVTGAYLQLYLTAARAEAGLPVHAPEVGPQVFGVRLVRLIVLARCGDAKQRDAARAGLATLATGQSPDGAEPWVEAWCRAGIGRSLIRETEVPQRVRGVIELLHVPARFASGSPDLAATCLAEAAVTLWELGDQSGAAALKAELLAQYASHPAARWSRLDQITATTRDKGPRESLPEAPAPGSKKAGGV